MAKKRVHEIAKAQGVTSKDLLAALNAAGVEAKAAASSVEEQVALDALKGGAKPKAEAKARRQGRGEGGPEGPGQACRGGEAEGRSTVRRGREA